MDSKRLHYLSLTSNSDALLMTLWPLSQDPQVNHASLLHMGISNYEPEQGPKNVLAFSQRCDMQASSGTNIPAPASLTCHQTQRTGEAAVTGCLAAPCISTYI